MHDLTGSLSSPCLCSHEGPVWQVSWAHPKFGTILASCSYDRKVMIHPVIINQQHSGVFACLCVCMKCRSILLRHRYFGCAYELSACVMYSSLYAVASWRGCIQVRTFVCAAGDSLEGE